MSGKRKHSEEMSIDEILKSIRGIINTHKKDKHTDDEDILELTEVLEDNQIKTNEDAEQEDLISPEIVEKVSTNIKDFTEKIKHVKESNKKSLGDITAEELLLQLLKPELKIWLDRNLPDIIDRTLRSELQRLIQDKNV